MPATQNHPHPHYDED